jgi:4-hydroxyphenylacetate 3-monooxygenase
LFELQQRRKALEAWLRYTPDFGRALDHVASCISGMIMRLNVFEAFDPKHRGASRIRSLRPRS